jgi:hypothetical protein
MVYVNPNPVQLYSPLSPSANGGKPQLTDEQARMQAEFQKMMANTEGRAQAMQADTGYGGAGDFLRGVVGGTGLPYDAATQDLMQRNTTGRANELRGDKDYGAVSNFLQGAMGAGANLPYSPEAINAMQSQYGRGSSAAEAAQMAALRESMGASGGSVYDPSYQAASRQAMGTRQGQNLDYQGQIMSQASIANAAARDRAQQMNQQAANALSSASLAHNAQISQGLGEGAQFAANAAQGNYGARAGAAGELAQLNAQKQAQINSLLGQANQYRAQQSMTKETPAYYGGSQQPQGFKPQGNAFSAESNAIWNAKPQQSQYSFAQGQPAARGGQQPSYQSQPSYQNQQQGFSGPAPKPATAPNNDYPWLKFWNPNPTMPQQS